MPTYAANTEVSTDRSKQEIERTLQRYGADQFIYGWDAERAVVGFRIANRQVKMVLPLPDRNAEAFTCYRQGGVLKRRTSESAAQRWEQACRQRWRALALVIKAKLEAVEAGISTIEREFLSDIVLPDGSTFGQWAEPELQRVYLTGRMPALLPAAPGDA